MDRFIALLIVTFSLLAMGNAALIYKRSFYLEAPVRVNLEVVLEQVDQMENSRLVSLSKRLAAISDSDFQILLIMNEQFRKAIAYLMASLIIGLIFMVYLMLKLYLKQQSIQLMN